MIRARNPLRAPSLRAAVLVATIAASAGSANAQSLTFNSKNSDDPIVVTAQQGLEWQQNDKRFVARGNAKAVQGDVNVVADELTAYYRDRPSPNQHHTKKMGTRRHLPFLPMVEAAIQLTTKSTAAKSTGSTPSATLPSRRHRTSQPAMPPCTTSTRPSWWFRVIPLS